MREQALYWNSKLQKFLSDVRASPVPAPPAPCGTLMSCWLAPECTVAKSDRGQLIIVIHWLVRISIHMYLLSDMDRLFDRGTG